MTSGITTSTHQRSGIISPYPHADTVVVTVANLPRFQSICKELGIEYHMYAYPSEMKSGTCLIKLSDDDMNLLLLSCDNIVPGMAKMKVFN